MKKAYLVKGHHPKEYYTIERVFTEYSDAMLYTKELNEMGLSVEVTLC